MSMTATINWCPFSVKHINYIKEGMVKRMSVAEGAIRSGKTIDNCIIASAILEVTPDRLHLASGSTVANAKLNIGDCNGFGLEHLFRGRCRWGKFKDNDALFIKTKTGEKIVIFAGGGKADSFKKILGNSYGIWIGTEINQHFDSDDNNSFIKVAFGRQVASKRPVTLWDLNPSAPKHPIYTRYIDKYKNDGLTGGYNYQHFTIVDNLSISPERRAEIESMYNKSSIWYKRDILGQRCTPEGAIYTSYVENQEKFLIKRNDIPPLIMVECGVDFGGTSSKNTFVAVGFTRWFKDIIVLKSVRIEENVDDNELKRRFVKFANHIYNKWGKFFDTNYDNAEPVLGRGLNNAARENGCRTDVIPAIKINILQRIRLITSYMDQRKFWILDDAEETQSIQDALYNAVWDMKQVDTRLDDGTSDIDTLDAFEYSFEKHYNDLINSGNSFVLEYLKSKEH